MKTEVIIGIDNGLSGGLCAISSFSKEVISFIPMPVYKVDDKTEIHTESVIKYLDSFNKRTLLVAIEEPLKHAKSSQAMRSMALSFGKLVGIIETLQVSCCRIQVKDWQDAVLGKRLAKGQTKVVALAKANAKWPDENWLATSRSKVAHDGIVDAALIALYTSQ